MPILVIGLIGRIKAGKGTVTEILRSMLEFELVHSGNFLRGACDYWKLPQKRENIQRVAIAMRREFGDDIVTRALTSSIQKVDGVVVYDSVRLDADVDMVKFYPHCFIVIKAPQVVRWERTVRQAEKDGDSGKTWEEFQADERRVTEMNIDNYQHLANFIITNDSTLDDLKARVSSVFRSGIMLYLKRNLH